MFTGLIFHTGEIGAVDIVDAGATLDVKAPEVTRELARGDSVAVNGVCLSAISVGSDGFQAQVTNETLRHTDLGALASGDIVNLELPPAAGDRLGGHFVQGHVDAIGTVENIAEDGFARQARISLEPQMLRCVADRGSIAVDGVSLTVTGVGPSSFSINLIPETLERTNLSRLRPGTRANVELDILAKYVERLVGRPATEEDRS